VVDGDGSGMGSGGDALGCAGLDVDDGDCPVGLIDGVDLVGSGVEGDAVIGEERSHGWNGGEGLGVEACGGAEGEEGWEGDAEGEAEGWCHRKKHHSRGDGAGSSRDRAGLVWSEPRTGCA
jgi:hypothetical protein